MRLCKRDGDGNQGMACGPHASPHKNMEFYMAWQVHGGGLHNACPAWSTKTARHLRQPSLLINLFILRPKTCSISNLFAGHNVRWHILFVLARSQEQCFDKEIQLIFHCILHNYLSTRKLWKLLSYNFLTCFWIVIKQSLVIT
jgi:hypothetical protein